MLIFQQRQVKKHLSLTVILRLPIFFLSIGLAAHPFGEGKIWRAVDRDASIDNKTRVTNLMVQNFKVEIIDSSEKEETGTPSTSNGFEISV